MNMLGHSLGRGLCATSLQPAGLRPILLFRRPQVNGWPLPGEVPLSTWLRDKGYEAAAAARKGPAAARGGAPQPRAREPWQWCAGAEGAQQAPRGGSSSLDAASTSTTATADPEAAAEASTASGAVPAPGAAIATAAAAAAVTDVVSPAVPASGAAAAAAAAPAAVDAGAAASGAAGGAAAHQVGRATCRTTIECAPQAKVRMGRVATDWWYAVPLVA